MAEEDVKKGFELVARAIDGLRSEVNEWGQKLMGEIAAIKIAVVETQSDVAAKNERFETTLISHGARIKRVEQKVSSFRCLGGAQGPPR